MTHYILLASFVCKGIMVSQSGVQAWGASSKYTLLISYNIRTSADPTSNLSSTCIVLALMAGCQKFHLMISNRRCFSAACDLMV